MRCSNGRSTEEIFAKCAMEVLVKLKWNHSKEDVCYGAQSIDIIKETVQTLTTCYV